MATTTHDQPATKADIQQLEAVLEAKFEGIKNWITGVAVATAAALILSVAAINISLIAALN